jgi:Rap1a immunity proteins
MRFVPLALAFLGLALAPVPAFSQAMTAGGLQQLCTNRAQVTACVLYIQGYIDGRNQAQARATVCIPAGRTINDVVNGFVTHVAGNRLEANLEAGLIVGNYLISNFPCR